MDPTCDDVAFSNRILKFPKHPAGWIAYNERRDSYSERTEAYMHDCSKRPDICSERPDIYSERLDISSERPAVYVFIQ